MTLQTDRMLMAAAELMSVGRANEAADLAGRALKAEPRHAGAHRLLGHALMCLGDLAGAERALRAALSIDKRQPMIQVDLADLLLTAGREAEAEKALRAALALDRRFLPAVDLLTRWLASRGRAEEAIRIVTPLTASGGSPTALNAHAEALRVLGRYDEAVVMIRRSLDALSPQPEQNYVLAAVLLQAERFEEAEAAARQALANGFRTPESLRALSAALEGVHRFDEAETVLREALGLDPYNSVVHRSLVQLLWRRTGEVAPTTATLDAALADRPGDGALRVLKAKVLETAGDLPAAYAALAPALDLDPPDANIELTASQVAVRLDPLRALAHARRAVAAAPDDLGVRAVAAEASLAAGHPEEAVLHADAMLALQPLNQQAMGLRAAAWRLTGDPRYGELYDYDAFVKTFRLEPPQGWSTLDAWLADFAAALDGMHGLMAHPIGQSLRQGSQATRSLDRSGDPAIRGFFEAIKTPIGRYIANLGKGRDPLRSRATGGFELSGSWSVRLRPGGHHVPHLHPNGWLSSACYIQLPDAIQTGREGWIAFGEPGVPTRPGLEAEHWVKPEPGLLVLFPSYMWHGTVPFSGDQSRLTCAFDVVPT